MDITRNVLLISAFMFMSFPVFSGDDIHNETRELFIRAGSESCKAHDLIQVTGTESTVSNVILAYRGAAYTLIADCVKSPVKKMKNFNTGKDIIDTTVAREPTNHEIRYIRIMVQHGAPSFLDYNNLLEDMDVFLMAIVKKNKDGGLEDFDRRMMNAVLSTRVPHEEQRRILDQILSN